ncbi:MAG TPA: cytochrome c-type biogenesis protein [Alphaproteobacteria bacterium]|jgi:cytochrome c-type biogenesis protein CcmH|nr:cytochrome c-type biogenesis protein [Alphaproteobacteria bacterium]
MRRLALLAALLVSLAALISPVALAIGPDEMLADPALEARARTIGQSLRCLVCQNQSIDDSEAGLARDLRILVRERLQAGDSNQQVVDYIVARYGDFVLLRPPVTRATYLLWFGPALLLLVAATAIVARARRKRATIDAPLSADEESELKRLMEPR